MTQNAALLVVDVQNLVMAESINAETITATIASLVDSARTQGVPVVWVRHNADAEMVLGSQEWQIVPQLTPAEGEPIVDKRYSDSFADTDLTDVLQRLGTERIVLCGAQTDACIRGTFYGGLYRGYPVTLVTDAHTTGDLRQWGATFSPEQSIDLLNLQAAHTKLPDVEGSVTTAAEAFTGAAPERKPS